MVHEAIPDALTPYVSEGLTGVTSPNYRDKKVKPANRATFDSLSSGATEVAYVVTYALEQGRQVLVVWPDGAERED